MPKVVSKRSIGVHKVYDLDIDHPDSSFHVNSIPVHNCKICRDLDGKEWKKLKNVPPIQHPRCRCTIVPITKYSDETEVMRQGVKYDETGEGEGWAYGDIDYHQWEASQPPAVRRAINSKNWISRDELKRLVMMGV